MQIPSGWRLRAGVPMLTRRAGRMRVGGASWPTASVQLAPLDDSRFVLTGRMSKTHGVTKTIPGARIKIASVRSVREFIAETH